MPASDLVDEEAIAILGQVELHSLTATPGTIAPFSASLIEWHVSGPAGFSVLLENTRVPRVGERLVTPLTTRTFRLKATAGRIQQVLGTVTVTVDQAACKIVPVPNPFIRMKVQESLDQLVAETPGASRRRPDVVTVDESGIEIHVALEQELPKAPNPDVNIDARWVYRSSNGELLESFDGLNVSVRFPWWVSFLPISFNIAIETARAKESTKARVREKAVEGARGLELFVDPGFRILSAGFNPANFEMLTCPDASLRVLVAVGAPAKGTISARGEPRRGPV